MRFEWPNTWGPGGGRIAKPAIWSLLGESVRGGDGKLRPASYRIHAPEVFLFHRSRARVRIAVAPARTSKSWTAAYDVIPDAMPEWVVRDGKMFPVPPQRGRYTKLIWIIGPDFKTNKEFDYIWRELMMRRNAHGMPYQLGRHSFNPKQGHMEIELLWGKAEDGEEVRTLIEGKSATSPEGLQGEEVDIAVMSEAAEQSDKIYARYLATRAKSILIPTTPKLSGAWVKNLIDIGESVSHSPECGVVCAPGCEVVEVGIESFLFTPRANPNFDWARYWQEHALAEARAIGKVQTEPRGHECFDNAVDCLAMRDPWFAEQFGGRWTFEADRVIPFKWMPLFAGDWCHVVDEVPDWLYAARHFVGVDYGFTDPACVHWVAQGPDGQLLLYREIYESKLDVEALARRIVDTNRMFGERVEFYVGDPQKPEVAKVFQRHGLPVIERNKAATRDRAAGHLRLVNALSPTQNGRPRLTVLSEKAGYGYGCPKTIQEWRTLKRKPGASSGEWSTNSIQGADHAFDCFHPDTEILTASGWKPVLDVAVGESVATRTHTTGSIEFRPVSDAIVADFDGELIGTRAGRDGHSLFAVTPNHKLLAVSQWEAKRTKRGRTHLVRAEDLEAATDGRSGGFSRTVWLPEVSQPGCTGLGLPLDYDGEAFAYFLGFYLAEGCRSISRGRKYVHLDNKSRDLLCIIASSLGFDQTPSENANGVYRLSIRSDSLYDILGEKQLSHEKRVPRWFFDQANIDEHRQLWNGLFDGDGSKNHGTLYHTVSAGLADDVQELHARLGRLTTRYVCMDERESMLPNGKVATGRPIYRVTVPKRVYRELRAKDLVRIPYTGPVGCVTVPPHHTILTRYKRVPLWMGNCARYWLSAMPNAQERQTIIEREMREIRRMNERFRIAERHKGPLSGPSPGVIHAA